MHYNARRTWIATMEQVLGLMLGIWGVLPRTAGELGPVRLTISRTGRAAYVYGTDNNLLLDRLPVQC